jgi:chromate reductase
MTDWKVVYLIRSLARKSINRQLAHALVRLAPKALVVTEIPIGELPLYSYYFDADFPAPAMNSMEPYIQFEKP